MKNFERDKDCFLHRVVGFLNFVGGNFTREELKEDSFEEVVDTVLRNGGELDISISQEKIKDMGGRNGFDL